MDCPNCGFVNRPDARYCGMCGHRLVLQCLACGSDNPTSYLFCIHCGAALRPDDATPDRTSRFSADLGTRPQGSNTALAEPQATRHPTLEGERRVATIILADVHGSTNLLESLGSETWVDIMNRMFQLLEVAIYRFGGVVDQFRGDGLVAFFGTEVAHEDDPERGVLAAMAMQRAIAPYAAELAAQEDIHLSLRVGVNTGEVIVASVGDDRTYSENTAMGEAIALAARMEQAAEPGTVLVSENTYRQVAQRFEWIPLGEIRVKGVSDPVRVYQPTSSGVQVEESELVNLSGSVIGRERARETLITCVEDLQQGRGGIVMVTGERGIGKSMLLQDVRRYLTRQRALRAGVQDADPTGPTGSNEEADPAADGGPAPWRIREIRARARSYEQSQPFAMWRDLLRQWLGTQGDEPKEKVRDRLHAQCEALWLTATLEHYPDLARFLGLPLEPGIAARVLTGDAEGTRQDIFLAIRSWLEQLTQQGPTVITFSDMHWADATSLELVKYCLPLCDYMDLLWVFVFRPDRQSNAWAFRHYLETEYPHRLESVDLAPLTEEQSRAMLHQMIGPDVLTKDSESLIVQTSEGNPLFLLELVRSLANEGILVRETDPAGETTSPVWRASRAVTALSLPDSLQSLLMARLSRLSQAEQQVLQRAAVVGYSFWHDILEAITPDPIDLLRRLTALQRAEVIEERRRDAELGVEYSFHSKLTRDAIYDGLLSSQRAAIHLQVAEYLERRFATTADGADRGMYYGTLAYHFRAAGRPTKELDYTLRNADRARSMYANAEAAQHYTHALALLTLLEAGIDDDAQRSAHQEQRLQILLRRHQVYYLMAEFGKMHTDAETLLPIARDVAEDGDVTSLVDALLCQPGVGDPEHRTGIKGVLPLATEALALAREAGDSRRELAALTASVNQRLALNDPSWRALSEEALELAKRTDDLVFEARLLIGLGGIYAFSDEPERGMQYLDAAAALAVNEGLDDRVVQLSLLNLLGLEFERSGDYHRLLTEYQQERLRASREIGHRPMEGQALQACGRIAGIYLGDYAAGLDLLEESEDVRRETPVSIYSMFHIAQIQIAQADHGSALETLAAIRRIGEPVLDRAVASLRLIEAMLCNARGSRSAARGDTEATVRHLQRGLELHQEVTRLAQTSDLVSRQYEMAANCLATVAHLGLAQSAGTGEARAGYLSAALEAAQAAYDVFQLFGFAQIVECVSEEVFLRYAQALEANDERHQANLQLRRAYDEMMRKHALIPSDSEYRQTYLDQVPLHREIRAAYASRVGSLLSDA